MAKTKRVVIVIVEGASDEVLMIETLKRKYSLWDIRFECQRGDIFHPSTHTTQGVKERIGDVVRFTIQKRKYKPTDVVAIIHLTDTEGCFIPNESIGIDENQKNKTQYNEKYIQVDSLEQQQRIIKRNQVKSQNTKIMISLPTIINGKYPYQLYYFSRTLEHVVFDEANPEGETKYAHIDEFVEDLTEPLELFLAQWMPKVSGDYETQYATTWQYIQNDQNSLARSTNTALLFDYLTSKVQNK